ncbi:META domain-containing protein [Chondrinema litorale]|uniref:META domain-containing protein n=1 Tax=Chondrinema litorale TaxID=2994555 RepID=UPI002543B297|nr:META domain-containing protein [Chondrinema litorale]UZR98688.1 META domain-containing protein [Chondrinema litorale]
MKYISTALLLIAFTACKKSVTQDTAYQEQNETTEQEVPATTLLNDIWVLETISNTPIDKSIYNELPYVEFHINENRVMGYSGCNNFNGTFSANDAKGIEVKQLMSTKKACIPPVNESEFLQLLQSSDNFDIREGKLFLYQEKDINLIFKKVD